MLMVSQVACTLVTIGNIIRAYGVEHHKALGQTGVPKTTLGAVPLGLAPFKFEAMAIPTTLLIDEAGIIRWIDQSEDIRIRSSGERVMDAAKTAFGEKAKLAMIGELV